MTKEELKQEAEEYAEGMAKYYASTHEDCIPSQFEKYLRNAYISSAEPREKRIAELECKLEQTEKDLADYQFNYPTIKELQKENAELKKEWQEQFQKATDEGYARTLQTIQLSKAKDIIKNLMVYVPVDLKEYEEAKQFLNEVNNALS